MDLGKDEWQLTALDVDAAVSRLVDAKTALAGNAAGRTGLPPLRTAGLTLLRRDRDARLKETISRAQGNAEHKTLAERPALTADDLVLGYRIDVREADREWRSLTCRVADYRVGEDVTIADGVSEEGHVKPATAVIGTDEVLRADEVVTRWSGSSLAIPRPTPGAPQSELMRTSEMPLPLRVGASSRPRSAASS